MEIIHYNSDSGDRDMKEKNYPLTYTFIQILNMAYERKAPLIVKTSYMSEERPGAWYIKGNIDSDYDEIKKRIEENVQRDWRTCRDCYLIKYL